MRWWHEVDDYVLVLVFLDVDSDIELVLLEVFALVADEVDGKLLVVLAVFVLVDEDLLLLPVDWSYLL